jgi:CRP-like cAMP-binding protein
MKTHQEITWIWNFFRRVDMFSALTVSEMGEMIDQIKKIHYGRGETIVRQGKVGDSFFIIYKGKVKAAVRKGIFNNVDLGDLNPGEFFGEMALVLDQPRSATVTAVEETDCFVVLKGEFQRLVQKNPVFSKIVNDSTEERAFEINQRT